MADPNTVQQALSEHRYLQTKLQEARNKTGSFSKEDEEIRRLKEECRMMEIELSQQQDTIERLKYKRLETFLPKDAQLQEEKNALLS